MQFVKSKLPGVLTIEPEPFKDERGFFSRAFCEEEFAAQGLETRFVQHSVSGNAKAGTFRGMHYQAEPHAEIKVVRCQAGAIYDIVLDLRRTSPTFGRWEAFGLSAENKRQVYIPKGCAHGFQTLADESEVHYLISDFYAPSASGGVRYDDPAFGITLPLPVSAISEKDRDWPIISQ